jgi:hypothetical protein
MYICDECRVEVDPRHPEVIYAVSLRLVDTFTGTVVREGPGVFFHAGCFPDAPDLLRLKPKPGTPESLPRAS